jgi:hypothetical protein
MIITYIWIIFAVVFIFASIGGILCALHTESKYWWYVFHIILFPKYIEPHPKPDFFKCRYRQYNIDFSDKYRRISFYSGIGMGRLYGTGYIRGMIYLLFTRRVRDQIRLATDVQYNRIRKINMLKNL